MRHVISLIFAAAIGLIAACGSAPLPVAAPPAAPAPDLARLIENGDATYRIDIVSRRGHGSGVALTHDGHILTVHHVTEGNEDDLAVTVTDYADKTPKPATFKARMVAADPAHDIAVIKIERRFRDVVILEDPANVRPGDPIYNIGYPYDFGEMIARGHIMRDRFTVERDPDAKGKADEMVIEQMLIADLVAGPGTSGSGNYLARNGKLVGLMRMVIGQGPSSIRMVLCGLVPVSQVLDLLHKHKIPYVRSDGTEMTYGTGTAGAGSSSAAPPPRKEPPPRKDYDLPTYQYQL